MAFIDQYRDRFGVEPICRVLRERNVGIAPSTYYAYKSRPPSARDTARRVADRTDPPGTPGQLWGVRRFEGVGTAQPARNTSSPVHSATFDAKRPVYVVLLEAGARSAPPNRTRLVIIRLTW